MKRKIFLFTGLVTAVTISLLLSATMWFPVADGMIFSHSRADVENIRAATDYNQNGTDDYADFVQGARADAKARPTYDPTYIETGKGFPDDAHGVCTDVIWRAFRAGGYDLRAMVNADIAAHPEAYRGVVIVPDARIDFRRVPVLDRFFARWGETLPVAPADPEAWQPGDVVVFDPDLYHIGILDARRNSKGFPYLIHNGGQLSRIDNTLLHREIHSHYRFNAEQVPPEILRPWTAESM